MYIIRIIIHLVSSEIHQVLIENRYVMTSFFIIIIVGKFIEI